MDQEALCAFTHLAYLHAALSFIILAITFGLQYAMYTPLITDRSEVTTQRLLMCGFCSLSWPLGWVHSTGWEALHAFIHLAYSIYIALQ